MSFKNLSIILLLLCSNYTIAQLKVGDSPNEIDKSSLLELESRDKAFVLSRVNTALMQKIKPLAGALIYNTDTFCVYHFDGKKWLEVDPVTKREGHYEVPVSSCSQNGKPVIAWNEIIGDKWKINVATLNGNGFSKPYTFPVKSGRSINPVLISPNKNRNWIAWENWEKGIFSIYISKYDNGNWSEPIVLYKDENSCFDPSIVNH